MDARSPCLEGHFRACYWYHAQFTRGSGKCKRSACCCYCRRFWTHCWPYAISFIENCVVFLKGNRRDLWRADQSKSRVGTGNSSYLQDLRQKEIFGQTGRTYSWKRDCKEGPTKKDEGICD